MSNVIVKAAMIGVPILTCDFTGKSKVVDFISDGVSEGCLRVEEVEKKIDLLLGDETYRKRRINQMRQAIRRYVSYFDNESANRIVHHLCAIGSGLARGRENFSLHRIEAYP